MTGDSCRITGCGRPPRGGQRSGICEMHYYRIRRNGTTEKVRVPKTCTECGGPVFGHGLCQRHYAAARRADVARPRCRHTDCRRAEEARGMCSYHHALTYSPDVIARQRATDAARSAESRRRHPDRYREQRRNAKAVRRARKSGAVVRATDLRLILVEHGMTCHLCGDAIASRADLHFDHVIPLAKGGAHVPENIRPAHAVCNQRKGARLPA